MIRRLAAMQARSLGSPGPTPKTQAAAAADRGLRRASVAPPGQSKLSRIESFDGFTHSRVLVV